MMDAIEQFKSNQKRAWANFALLENLTATTAPYLIRFAGVRPGLSVLDVACGTGVVALTAAREGANVQGLDLTPELVVRARGNAALLGLDTPFTEGDVESLPFPDATFDVVLSQFGHMFAPRPDVAIREMLRVLRPGGTIAFSTWPPERFVGRWFTLMASYAPPAPPGVSPPAQWGDHHIVADRLGSAVRDVNFARQVMQFPVLSPRHYRVQMGEDFGPAKRLLQQLDAEDPAKAARLRSEIEALVATYFEDNRVRQDFLMTRAIKV